MQVGRSVSWSRPAADHGWLPQKEAHTTAGVGCREGWAQSSGRISCVTPAPWCAGRGSFPGKTGLGSALIPREQAAAVTGPCALPQACCPRSWAASRLLRAFGLLGAPPLGPAARRWCHFSKAWRQGWGEEGLHVSGQVQGLRRGLAVPGRLRSRAGTDGGGRCLGSRSYFRLVGERAQCPRPSLVPD